MFLPDLISKIRKLGWYEPVTVSLLAVVVLRRVLGLCRKKNVSQWLWKRVVESAMERNDFPDRILQNTRENSSGENSAGETYWPSCRICRNWETVDDELAGEVIRKLSRRPEPGLGLPLLCGSSLRLRLRHWPVWLDPT